MYVRHAACIVVKPPTQSHSSSCIQQSLHVRITSQLCFLQRSQCDTWIDPQCYFLLGASASTPLLYYVDRVRDGRSYATRSVRAVQGGRNVFIMLCSFQKPEPWQPSRHWSMPPSPRPDECDTEIEHILHMAADRDVPEQGRARLLAYAKVRFFFNHTRLWVAED